MYFEGYVDFFLWRLKLNNELPITDELFEDNYVFIFYFVDCGYDIPVYSKVNVDTNNRLLKFDIHYTYEWLNHNFDDIDCIDFLVIPKEELSENFDGSLYTFDFNITYSNVN